MGQAFLGRSGRELESGTPRFRMTGLAPISDDPIHQVSEAVELVLNDLRPRALPRKDPACQVLVGNLLSVRQVEALPQGTRAVQVGCGVVVTPLAQELLKCRGISIRVGSQADTRKSGAISGEWGF